MLETELEFGQFVDILSRKPKEIFYKSQSHKCPESVFFGLTYLYLKKHWKKTQDIESSLKLIRAMCQLSLTADFGLQLNFSAEELYCNEFKQLFTHDGEKYLANFPINIEAETIDHILKAFHALFLYVYSLQLKGLCQRLLQNDQDTSDSNAKTLATDLIPTTPRVLDGDKLRLFQSFSQAKNPKRFDESIEPITKQLIEAGFTPSVFGLKDFSELKATSQANKQSSQILLTAMGTKKSRCHCLIL